jgi:2-keto-3-deoxy-L-rhamnonate aldolase RhmA
MEIIRPNRMKRKLIAGQPVFGAIITVIDPELVEIAGMAGLDYIWMDFEHINLDWDRAQSCVLAAELHGITPIIRPTEVPGYREYMIQRALNIGFQGAVLTGVRNPADMQSMLDVMKFWPDGRRGVGHGRVHERAGERVNIGPEVLAEMNAEVFAAILIESAEGVEKIDDLCAMPGVDAVGLGHRDYAMDAGLPDFDYFQAGMQDALQRINDGARRHGKAYFGAAGAPDEMRRQIGEGAQIFTMARDTGVWRARCEAARALAEEAGA